jgi:predicted RNA-binding Zn-ribbon protein involved in translation (DUF1610 family)
VGQAEPSVTDGAPAEADMTHPPMPCPACGSNEITGALRDTHVTAENLTPEPLTYGLVLVCRSCGHEWKPPPGRE